METVVKTTTRTACAVLVTALLAVAGCATCRNHPFACGVAGALVAGSIAATIAANDHHRANAAPHRIVCDPGVTACGSAP